MWTAVFFYNLKKHAEDKTYLELYSSLVAEYGCEGLSRFTVPLLMLRNVVVIPILIGPHAGAIRQTVSLLCINVPVYPLEGEK